MRGFFRGGEGGIHGFCPWKPPIKQQKRKKSRFRLLKTELRKKTRAYRKNTGCYDGGFGVCGDEPEHPSPLNGLSALVD